MSISKVEKMVETYLNGNVSDFKKWLKKASKKDTLDAIIMIGNYWHKTEGAGGYEAAIRIIYQYL